MQHISRKHVKTQSLPQFNVESSQVWNSHTATPTPIKGVFLGVIHLVCMEIGGGGLPSLHMSII
jgi:hypothetical protein